MQNRGHEDDPFGDMADLVKKVEAQRPPTSVAQPVASGQVGQRVFADGTPMPDNARPNAQANTDPRRGPTSRGMGLKVAFAVLPFFFAVLALIIGIVVVRSQIKDSIEQVQVETEALSDVPSTDLDPLAGLGMDALSDTDRAQLISDVEIVRCELNDLEMLDTEIMVTNNLDRDLALLSVTVQYSNGTDKGDTANQNLFVGTLEAGASTSFSMMTPTILDAFDGSCSVVEVSN